MNLFFILYLPFANKGLRSHIQSNPLSHKSKYSFVRQVLDYFTSSF